MSKTVEQRLRKIKLLITDVDGVLTEGSIYLGNDGVELKRFSIHDGAAVAFARAAGLKLAVISGRYSPATESRMKELGIDEDCYQGSRRTPFYQRDRSPLHGGCRRRRSISRGSGTDLEGSGSLRRNNQNSQGQNCIKR